METNTQKEDIRERTLNDIRLIKQNRVSNKTKQCDKERIKKPGKYVMKSKLVYHAVGIQALSSGAQFFFLFFL